MIISHVLREMSAVCSIFLQQVVLILRQALLNTSTIHCIYKNSTKKIALQITKISFCLAKIFTILQITHINCQLCRSQKADAQSEALNEINATLKL